MSENWLHNQHVIIMGVISSNKNYSNSIRNRNLIAELKEKNKSIYTVDFGWIFNAKFKISKFFILFILLIKSFFLVIFNPKSFLVISTNPKWLLIIPIILRKNFTLYLGDPFIGDVAKKDTIFYKYIWKLALKLIERIYVFSPFIYDEYKSIFDHNKIKFIKRSPIPNLPKMVGEGILYLGDYSPIDRNFSPLISVLKNNNVRLGVYGTGDRTIFFSIKDKSTVSERKPLKTIMSIIPNFKVLLIVLNKNGNQVPGKVYDFVNAPFKVLVLYEDYLDIKKLPQIKHYFYCRNNEKAIKIALDELL
jgi:hypothetical protein